MIRWVAFGVIVAVRKRFGTPVAGSRIWLTPARLSTPSRRSTGFILDSGAITRRECVSPVFSTATATGFAVESSHFSAGPRASDWSFRFGRRAIRMLPMRPQPFAAWQFSSCCRMANSGGPGSITFRYSRPARRKPSAISWSPFKLIPATGSPNPVKVKEFLTKYPDSARAIAKSRAIRRRRDSRTALTTASTHSVSSMPRELEPVRWSMVPDALLVTRAAHPIEGKNYLFDSAHSPNQLNRHLR